MTLPSWDEMRDLAHRLDAHRLDAHRLDAHTSGSAPVEWSGEARPGALLPAFADTASGNTQTPHVDLMPFIWGYPLPTGGKLVYNARIENAGSPLWASSFASGRAIVAVSAFFEPHRTETERSPLSGRTRKRAYEFHSADSDLLLLGAITEDGRISIVTTEPNASVAPVHPRMPLVLSFEEVPTWFGPDWPLLADRSAVKLRCAPENPDENAAEQLALF